MLCNQNFSVDFRYGHPFELPLLAQSIIMTFAMLVLLELCTRIKRESEMSAKRRYIWSEYFVSTKDTIKLVSQCKIVFEINHLQNPH